MGAWKDRRWQVLLLPVIVLQLAYLLSGSPQHSTVWAVLSGYMVASASMFILLAVQDQWRNRHARAAERREARLVKRVREQVIPPRAYIDANGNRVSPPSGE